MISAPGLSGPTEEHGGSLRSQDWKFLLRRRDAPAAVAKITRRRPPFLRPRRGRDSASGAELVLLGFPGRRSAARARAKLAPGGEVVCHWWLPRPLGTRRARAHLVAAGLADCDFYWPGPVPIGNPEFWLPTEHPGAIDFVLSQRPPHSIRDRALRLLWRAAARWGALAPIYAVARVPDSRPAGYAPDGLEQLLPAPEPWVLLTGGSADVNKVVGLPFAGAPTPPPAVVMFCRETEAEEGIEWEIGILDKLQRERPQLRGVPRIEAQGQRMGRLAIAQTALHGTPLNAALNAANFAEIADLVTQQLLELAGTPPAQPAATWMERIVAEPVTSFGQRFSARGGPDPAAIMAALSPLGDLPLVVEHRDLKPWNLVLNEAGPAIIDWEDADPEGLPALDLVLFLSTAAFLVDGTLARAAAATPSDQIELLIASRRRTLDPESATGRVAATCMRTYCDALGIDADQLDRLRLLCWIRQALALEDQGPAAEQEAPGANPFRPELFVALAAEELGRLRGRP